MKRFLLIFFILGALTHVQAQTLATSTPSAFNNFYSLFFRNDAREVVPVMATPGHKLPVDVGSLTVALGSATFTASGALDVRITSQTANLIIATGTNTIGGITGISNALPAGTNTLGTVTANLATGTNNIGIVSPSVGVSTSSPILTDEYGNTTASTTLITLSATPVAVTTLSNRRNVALIASGIFQCYIGTTTTPVASATDIYDMTLSCGPETPILVGTNATATTLTVYQQGRP